MQDRGRRFYKSGETKLFDGIECQWPMFYLYLIIDGCFTDNEEQVKKYWNFLTPRLLQLEDGAVFMSSKKLRPWFNIVDCILLESIVVPEYYFFPEDCIFQERCNPGTQTMCPSTDIKEGIFLWGQSLYVIASLLCKVCFSCKFLKLLGQGFLRIFQLRT